jgi:sec-independent protein translocase protein TatA
MIGMLGPETATILLLIAIVFFGAKRLPEMARSLGKAKTEFIKGQRESDEELKQSQEATPTKKEDQPE